MVEVSAKYFVSLLPTLFFILFAMTTTFILKVPLENLIDDVGIGTASQSRDVALDGFSSLLNLVELDVLRIQKFAKNAHTTGAFAYRNLLKTLSNGGFAYAKCMVFLSPTRQISVFSPSAHPADPSASVPVVYLDVRVNSSQKVREVLSNSLAGHRVIASYPMNPSSHLTVEGKLATSNLTSSQWSNFYQINDSVVIGFSAPIDATRIAHITIPFESLLEVLDGLAVPTLKTHSFLLGYNLCVIASTAERNLWVYKRLAQQKLEENGVPSCCFVVNKTGTEATLRCLPRIVDHPSATLREYWSLHSDRFSTAPRTSKVKLPSGAFYVSVSGINLISGTLVWTMLIMSPEDDYLADYLTSRNISFIISAFMFIAIVLVCFLVSNLLLAPLTKFSAKAVFADTIAGHLGIMDNLSVVEEIRAVQESLIKLLRRFRDITKLSKILPSGPAGGNSGLQSSNSEEAYAATAQYRKTASCVLAIHVCSRVVDSSAELQRVLFPKIIRLISDYEGEVQSVSYTTIIGNFASADRALSAVECARLIQSLVESPSRLFNRDEFEVYEVLDFSHVFHARLGLTHALCSVALESVQIISELQRKRLRCGLILTDRFTMLLPPRVVSFFSPVDSLMLRVCGLRTRVQLFGDPLFGPKREVVKQREEQAFRMMLLGDYVSALEKLKFFAAPQWKVMETFGSRWKQLCQKLIKDGVTAGYQRAGVVRWRPNYKGDGMD